MLLSSMHQEMGRMVRGKEEEEGRGMRDWREWKMAIGLWRRQ